MDYNTKLIFLVLAAIINLQQTVSQSCTFDVSTLQCGQPQDGPTPPATGIVQKIPGKRGPPGAKGEKGSSYGLDPTQLENLLQEMNDIKLQYSTNVELFRQQQKYIESLEERLDLNEQQIQEMTRLRGEYTANSGSLARFNCRTPNSPIRSCVEVPAGAGRVNGTYVLLQPYPTITPFVGQCFFNGDTVITTLHHNIEQRERPVTKCASQRCFNQTVDYSVKMEQARSLIHTTTGTCRQFVKYKCHGSLLFENGVKNFAGWKTWDNRIMNYWGGADNQYTYCECGLTGSCSRPEDRCNCDRNDAVWREDSGYLSVQGDLPVTELYFGDTDAPSEDAFFEIGPLECVEQS